VNIVAELMQRRGRLIAAGTLAGLAAVAGAAISVEHQALEAERAHPPRGRFMEVDGVRLHYTDTGGPGQAVVMFHGNGAMMADLEISGIVERSARRYRTVLFDRPGYGYSERPRGRNWGPVEQARLLHQALAELGVERPILFGHSWGCLVALAMALDHQDDVGGLVLAAGYYFPQARKDVAALSVPAAPVAGDILRHTLAPFLVRRLAPRAIGRMFAPLPVPEDFRERFPLALALRPSQIRASTEELSMINSASGELARRYREIDVPAAIVAGEADEIVETPFHSIRLHEHIASSTLHLMPEMGHMLHHFETDKLADVIHGIAARLAFREAKESL
jgi:pimeloyl-ACP methyl ester carboxylesterase